MCVCFLTWLPWPGLCLPRRGLGPQQTVPIPSPSSPALRRVLPADLALRAGLAAMCTWGLVARRRDAYFLTWEPVAVTLFGKGSLQTSSS